ncbi:MAG: sodium:proton antiporter [Desulfobacterales bacterium]|jgi:CPA1 family monovalent cation:H+ antiporter|nr:sodium:proton antiporter [Desulfobacterales bacterium]MDH4009164.1 sodium:proton antiporter [Desulfobacterales bacterium]
MKLYNILAVLITLSAGFSYINHRFIRLPTTIGLMAIALLVSLGLIALGPLGFGLKEDARLLLNSIDFDETLLHGMLSFLLFAGALHVNLADLARQKYIIGTLATLGVIGSTFIVGFTSLWVLGWLGIELPFIYCLLFGALISPTDPIAVMGILKRAGVPESLETKITGESLFNDGVAVVVFLVILEIATGTQGITAASVAALFLKEVVGGLIFGLLIGAIAYWMLKSVENYQVEILITLALVTGGFALADVLHLSGPIAIVVAGLLIGNHGRMLAMSDEVRDHLDNFWELVDEILNAVLFVLIGLEVLILTFNRAYILAGIILIPLLLAVRFVCVGIPVVILKRFRTFSPHVIKILTWGGLRGGISVALALSLPAGENREAILAVTYAIVVFSIIVQGLTIGRLVKSKES